MGTFTRPTDMPEYSVVVSSGAGNVATGIIVGRVVRIAVKGTLGATGGTFNYVIKDSNGYPVVSGSGEIADQFSKQEDWLVDGNYTINVSGADKDGTYKFLFIFAGGGRSK